MLGKTDNVFTVMSYNIGNGMVKPDCLVNLLQQTGADIVGLQEVSGAQAEVFPQINGQYPYQAVSGVGIPGKAILSTYQISDPEQLFLYPERPDLRAALTMQDRRVTVFVAHPLPQRIHRNGVHFKKATFEQLARLGDLASNSGAAVMMGDFNMTERNQQYAALVAKGLTDAFRAAGKGSGFTLPARWARVPLRPFVRVDYIWHSSHFHTLAAWLGTNVGSDHIPVLAQLTWRETYE
jgi:endonuclease/exonuclease/phosphatase (EEP) superfamily protein YafD